MLSQDGDQKEWLSAVRDFLGAESATLATLHSHSAESRNPYSSLDSESKIETLISKALQSRSLDPFPSQSQARWIESSSLSSLVYVNLTPAPQEGRASLLIFEFNSTLSNEEANQLALAATLAAREARLVLETERRISAEEMFYHSQKLNCMGQLAGGIAHDFNNLLTVIQGHTGFLELASETWNDPKLRESLELIQNATLESVGLVKQLLLFSRDQNANFETLELNEVVDDFAKMVRRMVEETITLKVDLDADAGFIRADKGMLSQILMNLVVNARDAMPSGGEIAIETKTRYAEGVSPQNGA